MIRNMAIIFILAFLFACMPGQQKQDLVNHKINVSIDPQKHFLDAVDEITIPAGMAKLEVYFLLNSELEVQSLTTGISVELDETEIKGKDFGMDREDFELSLSITQNKYKIVFNQEPEGSAEVILKFSGKVHNPIKQLGAEYARGFSQSPGIIDEKGVYLGGSSYWVPWFNEDLITFELTAVMPEKWDAVSQGRRTLHEIKEGHRRSSWTAVNPMEEVYLIAAEFTEYNYTAADVDVMAFLRTPDENLANKYLETTAQYLEMYKKMLGPYPFSKFALIENFWETGYGMASFTLLGPRVIRFPFILHSSYPHELLHNWWGNSVYVDFDKGNWCEGLTAYMADHLIKEQRGQGLEYRRSTLQKYSDYVNQENDFPLNEFQSRHDAASEAVGYGKSLMFFNMLRSETGDEQFIKAFQKFYKENRFKFASFDDIRKSFDEVSGKQYSDFFKQWTSRTGAPELSICHVETVKKDSSYMLQFTLKQLQEEAAFKITVPVTVSLAKKTEIKKILLDKKEQTFSMNFSDKPLFVQIDPRFQLFRRLDPNEIPPSLSKIFGSEKILILLPSRADQNHISAYKQLAGIWSKDKTKDIEVKMDSEISELPADRAVWIFGMQNLFAKTAAKGIKEYGAELNKNVLSVNSSSYNSDKNSIIAAARHPKNENSVIALLSAAEIDAIPGLARKLPHYGKYSYLVFEGSEPSNIAKGQWEAVNSPLNFKLTDNADVHTELPKRKALAVLAPVFNEERMTAHIEFLADEELKGRAPGTDGIEKAADYIAEQFTKAGLKPGADDGSYFQVWDEVIDAEGNKGAVKNIIGIIQGTNKELDGQSVVVCAHYDHLGLGWPDVRKGNEGKIHPGADDNASGVSVMLELARVLGRSLKPARTIVFIAFTSEESGMHGSKYYVKHGKRFPAKKVIGALNLDTVGRLDNKKLLVINSSSAREWKFIFMGAGYVTGVEAEMVTQDLEAGDHVSFIETGIPAVQFFSGAHSDYHRPSDTADKIDAAGMAKIAAFVREGIVYLAEREEPLNFTGTKEDSAKKRHKPGGRSVTTGSMPDFTYQGRGVKIGGLAPDSPAAKAGLQKGDVIVKLGSHSFSNLREYSDVLKKYKPGDRINIVFVRNGKEITAEIELASK